MSKANAADQRFPGPTALNRRFHRVPKIFGMPAVLRGLAMQGLLAAERHYRVWKNRYPALAVVIAEALIAELDKEAPKVKSC